MNHYMQITRQTQAEFKTLKVKAGTENTALNKARDAADEWAIDIGRAHIVNYDVLPSLNKAKKGTVTYRVNFRTADGYRSGIAHVPAKLHENGWMAHPSSELHLFIKQELNGYLKNTATLRSFDFAPWNIEEI